MFPNNNNHQITTITTNSDEPDTKNTTINDGSLVQVVRRPRGRPPGTKNKPKSSVSVTRQPDPCMSPYVLEVNSGSDIIAAVRKFCNNRRTSLCVLSGSGTVCNLSLRVRVSLAPTALFFQGCYDLVSISATVIPSSSTLSTMLTPKSTNSDLLSKFVVSMVSPEGQMFGGFVVGPLTASGTVYIVAATLKKPNYYRLPMEDDNHTMSSEDGYVPVPIDQSLGSGGQQHHAAQPVIVEPLSMYGGCHYSADSGWPPTPPPHSSHY